MSPIFQIWAKIKIGSINKLLNSIQCKKRNFKCFSWSQVKVRAQASSLDNALTLQLEKCFSSVLIDVVKEKKNNDMFNHECGRRMLGRKKEKESEGGLIKSVDAWLTERWEKERQRLQEITWGRIWIDNHALECTQVTGGSGESRRPFVRVLYFDSRLSRLPVLSNAPFGCKLHVGEWKQHHRCHHPSFSIGGGTACNNEETRDLYKDENCAVAGWLILLYSSVTCL